MPDIRRFVVTEAHAGQRLDRFLAAQLPELSRSRIAELIDEGHVLVRGRRVKRAHAVAAGESIELEIKPRPALDASPEEIPLDVLYEDADVVVINKSAGMVVHAGAGHARGTLVNALLHRFGKLSTWGGAQRPGLVHRLDKETSGAMVVARTDEAHRHLAEAFRARRVEKIYLALLHGRMKQESGTIALPVARDPRRPTRMTARRAAGRAARTDWRALVRLENFTLVAAALRTGRTHQLRVHFSALGHAVVGDSLYGAPRQIRIGRQTVPPLPRNFLHAARISFMHPCRAEKIVTVVAPLPEELQSYLRRLADALGESSERLLSWVDAARIASLKF